MGFDVADGGVEFCLVQCGQGNEKCANRLTLNGIHTTVNKASLKTRCGRDLVEEGAFAAGPESLILMTA